jgi:hypothetical protein
MRAAGAHRARERRIGVDGPEKARLPREQSTRAAAQYRFAGYRFAVLRLFKTRVTSFDPRRMG